MTIRILLVVLGILAQKCTNVNSTNAAANQLSQWELEHRPESFFTTDGEGREVPSSTASKTVGPGGQMLLNDYNYFNHIAELDGSVIPERVIHAKGAGAHGYFQLSRDLSQYTKAELFSSVGKQVPVTCRLSTGVGEKGSAETVRDVRGISCKFYTDQGNMDLVLLTGLVFGIRDPMLFPSLVHSHKRNPQTNLPDPNMMFDFRSHVPETVFQTLVIFSDQGIPDGYRFMDVRAMSTLNLVNARGVKTLCRFQLKSNQGVRYLPVENATILAGTDPDYATRDLYNAIENGQYPSWTLNVQLMTPEQAGNLPWNPFDPTKQWPEEKFPPIPVGKVVLNRNPTNHFTEVEMLAVDPTDLLPGIEASSQDPLFDGRSFSYRDAQRSRLGINFELLPINKPKIPTHTYFRDGACALNEDGNAPNYFPNTFGGPRVNPSAKESTYVVDGVADRWDSKENDDGDYVQAREFLAGLGKPEVERLMGNLAGPLAQCVPKVRQNMVNQFRRMDPRFAAGVEQVITKLLVKTGKK